VDVLLLPLATLALAPLCGAGGVAAGLGRAGPLLVLAGAQLAHVGGVHLALARLLAAARVVLLPDARLDLVVSSLHLRLVLGAHRSRKARSAPCASSSLACSSESGAPGPGSLPRSSASPCMVCTSSARSPMSAAVSGCDCTPPRIFWSARRTCPCCRALKGSP